MPIGPLLPCVAVRVGEADVRSEFVVTVDRVGIGLCEKEFVVVQSRSGFDGVCASERRLTRLDVLTIDPQGYGCDRSVPVVCDAALGSHDAFARALDVRR
ncbi:hypothetical protein CH262_24700 [Rhodococcus sp. 05-2255-1e]|nr:hypothetical protein CH262_24700 [Rhodococcus sp. 05-2255-1e]